MSARRLVVFLKAPRPGHVKTRLAASLDGDAAAAIYRVLVQRTLAAARRFARTQPATTVELRFTPADADPEIAAWRESNWISTDQGDGDLGQRLRRTFDHAFAQGASRVIVVGTDCPSLTDADLTEAFAALDFHEVVLGPALDGGYWLLGLRAPAPTLFEDMPWSTSTVFAETHRRAAAAGLHVKELRRLADIDTLEDWRTWLRTEPL